MVFLDPPVTSQSSVAPAVQYREEQFPWSICPGRGLTAAGEKMTSSSPAMPQGLGVLLVVPRAVHVAVERAVV